MTPAERDEVREAARIHIEACERVDVTANAAIPLARAVLAFAPPGDVQAPEGWAIDECGAGVVYLTGPALKGVDVTLFIASPADAEHLAWALLAAVASARTTHAPATGKDT